jgi:hypothetical protein
MDKSAANKMKAQMIHFGGCRDGASSTGYQQGGAFTVTLCNVWKDGEFRGDYKKFHAEIRDAVESGQQVQYHEYGPVADAFRKERPFTTGIEIREARRQAATAGAR